MADKPAGPALRSAPARAMVYMLLAVALFAVTDTAVKWLTADYSVWQIVFVSRIVGVALAFALALRAGGIATLRTRRSAAHAGRAMLGLAMLLSFFFALRDLPLADAYAIAFAAPLIMTALSVPLLGERVGPRRWAAVVVGFAGVLIIVRPTGAGFDWAALLVLASACCYALVMITGRQLSATESSPTLMFYFALYCLVATALVMPWVWRMPSAGDWLIFLMPGLCGSTAAYLVTQAFRYGEVSLLAPLEYTALIWATLLGFLFWQDVPHWTVFAGAGLIVASSLYIARREARTASRQQAGAP